MPTKSTTETLITAPRPTAKRGGKGSPPAAGDKTAAVGNNTSKPAGNEQVDFNMKVPASFKVAAETFRTAHSMTRKSWIMDLIKKDMESKGWTIEG